MRPFGGRLRLAQAVHLAGCHRFLSRHVDIWGGCVEDHIRRNFREIAASGGDT